MTDESQPSKRVLNRFPWRHEHDQHPTSATASAAVSARADDGFRGSRPAQSNNADASSEPVGCRAREAVGASKYGIQLADLTTLGIGGPVNTYLEAATETDLIDAIRTADENNQPLLVIGGGSNLIAGDAPFPGIVLRDTRSTIKVPDNTACGGATVTVTAGHPWDDLVATAIENEWMGIEALTGIPGTVGAAPVQNIGAYGQEVAETIAAVHVWDRSQQRKRLLALAELEFGYRTSILKQSYAEYGPSPRYIVLAVQFQFRHASLSAPVRYKELANHLGVDLGQRVPAIELRKAVADLRARKGMVLNPDDRDTYSAGSFFKNPILSLEQAELLPADAPRYPVADHAAIAQIGAAPTPIAGLVKTSAAWLIEHAGFSKGFTIDSRAALSSKHVLAVTNRGGATAADVANLAREVRAGVHRAFGITLEPEPITVGFEL